MLQFIRYGKGGGSTSTTEVDIPESLKPYIVDPGGVLPEAKKLYGSTPNFGQPDVAGKTTKQAWQSGIDYANLAKNTLNPQMMSLYQDIRAPGQISGDVLNNAIGAATNPLREQYARTTIPTIEDAALSAGQFGGSRQGIAEGLAKSELDKNVANLDAGMRYQAATDDITRQIQGNQFAAQFTPTMYDLFTTPTNVLSNVGQQQDYFANLAAKTDLNNLLGYGDFIRQFIPGASSSTRTQQGGSKLGGALAGAGSGAMIGSSIGGAMASGAATGSMAGPWGAAIGAGVGALGSLLS